jgi:type II secretory pathway pseudopilin PulG
VTCCARDRAHGPTESTIRTHAHSGAERAFTLVELIVGFVLLAIALALAGSGLVQGLGASDRATEGQRLRTQFDQARTMLANDLRSARAPGRSFDQLRDLVAFREEIAKGNNALPNSWDLHDVKRATPTQLTFVGDAISDPVGGTFVGPECISWRLRTTMVGANRSWLLERGIAPYTSTCPDTAQWQWATWIGPILVGADASNVPAMAFQRYQLTCNPSVCVGATGGGGTGTGKGKGKGKGKATTTTTGLGCGDPELASTVTDPLKRGWITSVDLDLGSVSVRRDSVQREDLRATITLRNRLSDDYQFALGCAQ